MEYNLTIPNIDKGNILQHILEVRDDGNLVGAVSLYDLRRFPISEDGDIYDRYEKTFYELQTWAEAKSNDLLILIQCLMTLSEINDFTEEFLLSDKILMELIMVNEEYRKKGIGTKLLSLVRDYFRCPVYAFVGRPLDENMKQEELLSFYRDNDCELIEKEKDEYILIV